MVIHPLIPKAAVQAGLLPAAFLCPAELAQCLGDLAGGGCSQKSGYKNWGEDNFHVRNLQRSSLVTVHKVTKGLRCSQSDGASTSRCLCIAAVANLFLFVALARSSIVLYFLLYCLLS